MFARRNPLSSARSLGSALPWRPGINGLPFRPFAPSATSSSAFAPTSAHRTPFASANLPNPPSLPLSSPSGLGTGFGSGYSPFARSSGAAATTSGVSGKKGVHWGDKNLRDGVDYLKLLKERDLAEFKRQHAEAHKSAVDSLTEWRKSRGEPAYSAAHMAKLAGRRSLSRLRTKLQEQFTGKSVYNPRDEGYQDPPLSKEADNRWAIDELKAEVENRYWRLREQIESMATAIDEDTVQSCVRGWLDETHGKKISEVDMSGWQESAKAPPKRAWVNLTKEDHASLAQSELPTLRKRLGSKGDQITDEDLTTIYTSQVSRRHQLDCEGEEMGKYPESIQKVLMSVTSTSEYVTDVSQLSGWQKKHLRKLCEIQDSNKSKDEIDKEMKEYVEKNRKDVCHTVKEEDNGHTTISFNGLDSGAKVTATLPNGKIMSVQRWAPKRAETTQSDKVDTSGINPFIARDGDSANWAWMKSQISNFDKVEKKRKEARMKEEQEEMKRIPRLGAYLGTDTTTPSSASSSGKDNGHKAVQSLDEWLRHGKDLKIEVDAVNALFQAVSVDNVTQALQDSYKLDATLASRFAMWAMDCRTKGWAVEDSDEELKMKWTNGAESMSSDIFSFAKSAGIDTKHKPEEILTTVMHAIMDDTGAKSWSNQEMEDWAATPNWRTGTAESLPATEAYSRMLTKIELHKLLSKTYKFDSKRTSALSTLAVDAAIKSGSLQTGLEGVIKMLKEKPAWVPDPTDKEFSWLPSAKSTPSGSTGSSTTTATSTSKPALTEASAEASTTASTTAPTTTSTRAPSTPATASSAADSPAGASAVGG